MTHAINIAYILPAVAILLLAVAVLVLARQLLRSQHTLKQLGEQLSQLKQEKTETGRNEHRLQLLRNERAEHHEIFSQEGPGYAETIV